MIRLLFALIVLGALGHFVRWVFSRLPRSPGSSASVQSPVGAVPVSTTQRLVTSAAKSVLIGAAVALVLFVGKVVYFEITRSAPARSSATDLPRGHA